MGEVTHEDPKNPEDDGDEDEERGPEPAGDETGNLDDEFVALRQVDRAGEHVCPSFWSEC